MQELNLKQERSTYHSPVIQKTHQAWRGGKEETNVSWIKQSKYESEQVRKSCSWNSMAVSRQIPFSSSSDPASDRHPSFADASLQEVLQLKLCTWVISAGSIQSSSKINNLIQFLLLSLFIFWWEPKGNNFLSKLLPPKRRSVKKCQGIARDQILPNQRIRGFFNKKYITRANRENSWNQLSPHLKKRWEGKTNRPSTEHYLHCLGVGKQKKKT